MHACRGVSLATVTAESCSRWCASMRPEAPAILRSISRRRDGPCRPTVSKGGREKSATTKTGQRHTGHHAMKVHLGMQSCKIARPRIYVAELPLRSPSCAGLNPSNSNHAIHSSSPDPNADSVGHRRANPLICILPIRRFRGTPRPLFAGLSVDV